MSRALDLREIEQSGSSARPSAARRPRGHGLPSGFSWTVLAALILVATVGSSPAGAFGYTVSNAMDSGGGSLRQAILDANANVGGAPPHTISFISGCPTVITLLSALPPLVNQTDVNGYTQAGSSVNTSATASNAVLCITLNGGGFSGIALAGAGSRLRGLNVQNAGAANIAVAVLGASSTVDGNFIGTNIGGTAAGAGTNNFGVQVLSASGVTVGGTIPAARNIVSGIANYGIYFNSASSGFIRGNLVGTNAAGTGAIPNGVDGTAGIQLGGDSDNNQVGGSTAAARNVVSGNNAFLTDGIQVLGDADGNTIRNNFVGLAVDGVTALGNGRHGIVIYDDSTAPFPNDNVVDENVISSNGRKGVAVDGVGSGHEITNNIIGSDVTATLDRGNTTVAPPGACGPDAGITILNGVTALVADNQIAFNTTGVLVQEAEACDTSPPTGDGDLAPGSDGNCIRNNDAGMSNVRGTPTVVFTGNWWGDASGPSGSGPGTGDSVSADVDFSGFLMSPPVGCGPLPVELQQFGVD